MLELILGNRGHGKSCYATYHALYDYHIKKKQIYSNYKLDIPYTPLKVNQMKDIHNASVIFDEAYEVINARLSMSKKNRIINYFVFESRKMDVDLFFVAQLSRTVDILIRDSADRITMCRGIYRGFDGKLKVKDKDTYSIEAVATVTYDVNNERYIPGVFNPKAFFSHYDTNERISTTSEDVIDLTWRTKEERNKLIIKLKEKGTEVKEIARLLNTPLKTVYWVISSKNKRKTLKNKKG